MAEYSEAFIGRNKIRTEIYGTLDSTNLMLKRKMQVGCELNEGLAIIADNQTAGRGRRGRTWLNTEGSLMMSLGVPADGLSAAKTPLISIASALGIIEVGTRFCPSASIKWPNDILVKGKKVCGILCELVVVGDRRFCIIGIGLNLNAKTLPDGLIYPATSLYLETNTMFDRLDIAGHIADSVMKYLNLLIIGDSSIIIEAYRSRCSTLGNMVKVSGAVEVEALAMDIDTFGRLVVLDSCGQKRTIDAADVSVRPN